MTVANAIAADPDSADEILEKNGLDREKFEALAECDIEVFFCPRFDASMRDISAASFIRQIPVHGLNARHLVVGDDFRFARNREGSLDDLTRIGPALELTVEQVPSVIVDGIRVSSTAIREALEEWRGRLSLDDLDMRRWLGD